MIRCLSSLKSMQLTDRGIIAPYILSNHEQYGLLPLCRKNGGEIFNYLSKRIYEAEQLLGFSEGLFPYNFDC